MRKQQQQNPPKPQNKQKRITNYYKQSDNYKGFYLFLINLAYDVKNANK